MWPGGGVTVVLARPWVLARASAASWRVAKRAVVYRVRLGWDWPMCQSAVVAFAARRTMMINRSALGGVAIGRNESKRTFSRSCGVLAASRSISRCG